MRKNHISGRMKRILAVACAAALVLTSVPANTLAYATEVEQLQEEVTQETQNDAGNDQQQDQGTNQQQDEGTNQQQDEGTNQQQDQGTNQQQDQGTNQQQDEGTNQQQGQGTNQQQGQGTNQQQGQGTTNQQQGQGTTNQQQGQGTNQQTNQQSDENNDSAPKADPLTISATKIDGNDVTSDVYYTSNETVIVSFEASEEPDGDGWKVEYKEDGSDKSEVKTGTAFTVTLSTEASYSDFKVSGKNADGVSATLDESVTNLSIVIDRTEPKVNDASTTTDANLVIDGVKYFGDDVTVAFTLSEKIPSVAREGWKVSYKKDGEEKTVDVASSDWKNDGDTIEISLSDAGKYTDFSVSGKDAVGKDAVNNFDAVIIMIDKADPEVTGATASPEELSIDGVKYYKNDMTIDFAISEVIPAEARGDWSVTFKKDGEDSSIGDLSWNDQGNGFKVTLSKDNEGLYTDFSVSGTDAAGRSAVNSFSALSVGMDKTEPATSGFSTVPTDNINGVYIGQAFEVSFKVTDNVVGVGDVDYYIGSSTENPGSDAVWNPVPVVGDGYKLVIDPSEQGVLFIRVADKLNNNNGDNLTKYSFIVENNDPIITASVNETGVQQSYTFTVNANDQETAAIISSGLKRIYYKVDGGTEQNYTTFDEPVTDFGFLDNGVTVDFPAGENGKVEGAHTVEFGAEDYSGRSKETDSITVYFDNTEPEIEITEDAKFVKDINDIFVTNDGTITIRVNDDESEGDEPAHGVTATITVKKDGTDHATKQLEDLANNFVEKPYSLSDLDITEEGSYEIIVNAKDGAGNEAEEKNYSFVFDNTAPTVTCEVVNKDDGEIIDGLLVFNGESFNKIENVEVLFTVTDDHMTVDPESGEWKYSYTLKDNTGENTVSDNVSEWTEVDKENGIYKFVLKFGSEEEGLYSAFSMSGKDAAGLPAPSDVESPVFKISTQWPKASLTMAQSNEDDPDTTVDESLYHNHGGFTVTLKDKAFDSELTEYTITIEDEAGVKLVVTDTGNFGPDEDVNISDEALQTKFGEKVESKLTVKMEVKTSSNNATKEYTAIGGGIIVATAQNEDEEGETTGYYFYDTIAPKLSKVTSEAGGETFYYGDDELYYVSSSEVKDTYEIVDKYPGKTTVNYKKDGEDADAVETEPETPNKLEVKLEGNDNKFTEFKVSGTDLAGNTIEPAPATGEGKYESDPEDVNALVEDFEAGNPIELKYGKVLDTVAPVLTKIESISSSGSSFNDGEDGYYYVSTTRVTDTYTVEDTNLGTTTVSYNANGTSKSETGTGTIEVNMKGDGKYNGFTVTGMDKAHNPIEIGDGFTSTPTKVNSVSGGNGTITLDYGKIIDTEKPRVTFSSTTRDDTDSIEGATRYYNNSFTGTFTVTDNNTLLKSKITGKLLKANGDNYYNNYAEGDFVTAGEFEGNTDQETTIVYSKTVAKKAGDGTYRFFISGKDKAGNTIEANSASPLYEKGIFAYANAGENLNGIASYDKILDTVAPTGVLTVSNKDSVFYKLNMAKDNFSLETYNPYQKKISPTISVKPTDKSPVKVTFTVDSTVDSQDKSYDAGNFFNDNVNVYPAKETLSAKRQIVTIKTLVLKDRAGNSITLKRSNKLMFDDEPPVKDFVAPTATIKATSAVTHRNADGRDLFNHAVTLKLTITDPGKNAYSSGLKNANYEVYVDGSKVTGDKYEFTPDGTSSAMSNSAQATDKELKYVQEFTINLTEKYQTNDIVVKVNAEDNSGNKMDEFQYKCGIDTVGPKITISYDNNSAQNEKYFKDNRTATITVIDRNIDNGKININTQVGVPGSFSWSSGGGNGGNDTWTKQLYYNTDGDYTLEVNGTDALGNKAEVTYTGTAPREFTVDKTKPVISVTFDNNSVQNGKYYKDPRTATITIREHNFRASDVNVSQTATIQKGTVSTPGVSGFSGGGDDHSAYIDYSNDGNYTLAVSYTDLAGNPADPVSVDEFVIDRTKPVVRFVNPSKNDSVFQGDISPQIEYSDINTTRGMASITLKGMKKSNVLEIVEDSFSDYQGVVRFENLKKVKENDDIYTATAVVTDLAGNEESATITFSVNRFGSTYDYNKDEFTTNLVDNYYTSQEGDVILREINVNQLTEKKLTLYKDGDNRVLVEGTDYKVEERQVNGHYEYIYTIFAKNFEEEGNYSIIATSKDKANNTNSNSSVKSNDGSNEVPLKFAIDKTEPTNEITGVDMTKNKFTEEEIILEIRPVDNMNAVASFIVRVLDKDGKEIQPQVEMSGEELAKYLDEHDGKYTLKVSQNTKWQTIEVITTDAAGNQSTDYTVANNTAYDVLVTTNLFYQYINRLPLVLATVAAVGGLIFFILWKRRKDDDEEEAKKA